MKLPWPPKKVLNKSSAHFFRRHLKLSEYFYHHNFFFLIWYSLMLTFYYRRFRPSKVSGYDDHRRGNELTPAKIAGRPPLLIIIRPLTCC